MKFLFSSTVLLFILFQAILFGNFYKPDRCTFPEICEEHFDNNEATAHTWLEAEDKENIVPFRYFLDMIPKPYVADCYTCCGCGGIGIDLYNDLEWPTEEALEEILQAHMNSKGSRLWPCDRGRVDNVMWRCENPAHCISNCWDGGYFRKWNHKYLHFFRHYLQYCSENRKCSCFWSETNWKAVSINDSVYDLLKDFADEELIDSDFSEYWVANRIGFDYHKGKIYEEEYYPNSHGMASSLVTYAFFYSQYHQILLSVAAYIDANAIYGNRRALNQTYNMLESIRDDFSLLYEECLTQHPHPKIYYERGMLKMHSGDTEEALVDIAHMMHLAKTDKYKDTVVITSEMYQQEGQVYADLGMYDEAITSLTEAIKQNPGNEEAYFSRAQAYFETGNFDQALSDYLFSDQSNSFLKTKSESSFEFEQALFKSLIEGGKDAAIDFVPSLCRSTYGMGEALWMSGTHPIKSSKYFVSACHEMANVTYDYFKKLDRSQIEGYCEELRCLYENFHSLSDEEKGRLIGYTIGKYGVDIFAGGIALKSIIVFKRLKQANQICNFEAMTVSAANKEIIVAEALKHASERDFFFKNVKYNLDAHKKHLLDHQYYKTGNSIWEHQDPEGLLRRFAGTGSPKRGAPGTPGYKEVVDFKEHIGIWINEERTIQVPTTRGTIHYGNKGAHIVPANPNPKIGK